MSGSTAGTERPEDPREPTVRELFIERLSQTPGFGADVAAGRPPDVLATMGGVRGILETVVPVVVFSTVYGVTENLTWSIVSALVPAVALAIWRLVAGEPVTQVIGGVLGIGLGAVIAARTGRAEDLFLPSILKNVGFAAVYLVSILARWPLIGVLLGFVLGEGTHWRTVPARRRVYAQASWLWVAMFGLRVAVQTPLYLAGQVAALGVVNIGLGLPLFFLTIWLTYVLVQRVPPAIPPEPEPDPATASP